MKSQTVHFGDISAARGCKTLAVVLMVGLLALPQTGAGGKNILEDINTSCSPKEQRL